jgi:hypothetical protein
MDIINLGATDGLPPVNWATIVEKLDAGSPPAPDAHNARTTWLTTVNENGSPHVTAVGALWLDGSFWFQTGSGTRKAHNVAHDPRCSIAVSILDADVVAEGEAERETDPATLTRLAKAWADQGWPAELDETGAGITAPVQRAVAGTTAVERLSDQATFGDRDTGHRAGRADSLQVLVSAQGGACPASLIDDFRVSTLLVRSLGPSPERTDNRLAPGGMGWPISSRILRRS